MVVALPLRLSVARAYFEQWRRALRLHQWAKNALVFVPLIASHQITNFEKMRATLIAFVVFGFAVLGDLHLERSYRLAIRSAPPDETEPTLCYGQIPIVYGLWVSIVLMYFTSGDFGRPAAD